MIGLHRHSHYSKRDAIAKIPDIVARTAELGQSAWALTDHGTTSGLMEAYIQTMKFNHEHGTNIKFIFGIEAYWIPDVFIKDRKLSRHIVLLAKNTAGYHNLLKLVTLGHGDKGRSPEHFYYTMRLTTDDIAKYREGLIVSSACRGGILADRNLATERAANFKHIFGDDFYLEIQSVTDPQQIDYNRFVLDLARRLDIKTIVTEDAHYVYKSDAHYHRCFLQIDNKGDYYATDDFYLHSDEDMFAALPYVDNLQQIIADTEAVADKCDQVNIPFGENHFPIVDCDDPKKAVVDFVRPFHKNKLKEKSKAELDTYRKRFKYELGVLEQCNYLTYFLINARLIKWCRDNGICVGRGRGSVCGSLVAFLMDITRVDPIKFNLFFERFANVERITPPDIDTDVPNSMRQAVIDYLKRTYKEVYHVRTFGTMADKAAELTARRSVKARKDLSEGDVSELAKQFMGIIQHFGIHASALIIFPSDPADFCAIEKQGDDYVCAYQFPDLERMGLLKLDILGMKTLDTIDQTLKLVKQNRGVDIDIDALPIDDHDTFEMLKRGDSLGCFQIESAGMVKLLKQLKPKSLFELVPLVALYRPSSIQSGVLEDYVSRSKSKQVQYIHKSLEPALKETFGVLLYQEQAMQIVQTVAGYSLAKADVFRRAIGHKDNEKMTALIEQFIKDGADNGYDQETMLKLAEWLKNCASYQFNKSHSAAYALLCYRTAYLKANFTVEYIVAYLNSHHDDKQEDLIPLVRYAINHGIKFLPPDILAQDAGWHVKDGMIITAVNFIKGIGNIKLPIGVNRLSSMPKNKILSLIKAGALDHVDERRNLVKEFLREDYVKRYRAVKKKMIPYQQTFDGLIVAPEDVSEASRKLAELEQQLKDIEKEFNGLISDNPAVDEFDVLRFNISYPFERDDLEKFDEPDRWSEEKRIVLCIVRSFKVAGRCAFVLIQTPAGKFFNVFMPPEVYAPLPINECCILSLEKLNITTVLSTNAWKS